MTVASQNCTWSLDVFAECYNAIKANTALCDIPLAQIKQDLQNVLVVPNRNENSRKVLSGAESGKPILLPGGIEVALNGPFISSSSTLAFELELDELCTAELLQQALETTFLRGAEPVEAGTLLFFQRYQYILNILGYLVTENKLSAVLGPNSEKPLLKLILASFKKIYAMLSMQNNLIDKQRATSDINDLLFVNKISYTKRQLFDLHDLLSQVLYSLVDAYADTLSTFDTYTMVTAHVNECIKNDEDIFLLHYVPVIAHLATHLESTSDEKVRQLHASFTKELKADFAKVVTNDGLDLSKSSMRSYTRVILLMFYIAFIPWCKQTAQRTTQFDFEKDILKQIEILISYGTIEQILCYCSESMHPETRSLLENGKLLEFRDLIQRNYPSMVATQLLPQGANEYVLAAKQQTQIPNLLKLFEVHGFRPSTAVCDSILAPQFHSFFSNFIDHAAIVLTQLRDSEEDFLLSSVNKKEIDFISGGSKGELLKYAEDFNKSYDSNNSTMVQRRAKIAENATKEIDLEELATCAELERFYMACVYTYSHRPELCKLFWKLDDQNIIGFITWGLANNTSPLITATFCILLGSLTYGHEGSSVRVWDLLVQLQENSFKKNDYSKISIDSILNSLNYYVDSLTESLEQELILHAKRQQEKQEHMYSGEARASKSTEVSTVQLSEDSITFVSGFFMLLSTLVENTDPDSQVCSNMREAAFARILPTVVAYLKFDNLISTSKLSVGDKAKRPEFFDSENRTVLLNLVLNLLSSFAKFSNLKTNCDIWNTIDRWLYHSLLESESNGETQPIEPSRYAGVSLLQSSPTASKSDISRVKTSNTKIGTKQAFKSAFCNITEIATFTRLLERLLKPAVCQKPMLPYPTDLGKEYRLKSQVGIWPYIEFLITEVFEKSTELQYQDKKLAIQRSILTIINDSLSSVDWNLYEDLAPRVLSNVAHEVQFASGLTVKGVEGPLSYRSFIRLHHSLAVINYLFDNKACKAIFDIINLGESVNTSHELGTLAASALECIEQILEIQNSFIQKLLPILQSSETAVPQRNARPMGYGTSMSLMISSVNEMVENIYYPSNLGTKGLGDFYDLMLMNITSVVQIALLVGNTRTDIATPALRILDKLSSAPVFISSCNISNDTLLQSDRLLSIFESIDESNNIKFSFIQQMESPNSGLETKLQLLSFLFEKLQGAKTMTIAHFLLGFEIRGGSLYLDNSERKEGLLHIIVQLLKSIVDLTSQVNYLARFQQTIEYGPTKLTCFILKVLIELCRSTISSAVTLAYLRQFDLIENFLAAQTRIDEMTIWETQRFDGDIQNSTESTKNQFVADTLARETFLSYVETQNLILQYFAYEIHSNKSLSRREHYMKLLLNGTEFSNGTPKILESLDIFNFQLQNLNDYLLKDLEKNYNLGALVQEICRGEDLGKMRVDVLVRLSAYVAETSVNSPMSSTESTETQVAQVMDVVAETQRVSDILTRVIFAVETKSLQSRSLHSWAQLIQVLTNQGEQNKGGLILQILQIILPKINYDYFERDMLFAEELISLSLFLCEIYEQWSLNHSVVSQEDSHHHGLHRLLPLLSTCVNGLLVSNSSVEFRSDIYLILNKFLQAGIKSSSMLKRVAGCILDAHRKIVDVICNDCVHSEGILRITSIMCLESLVHLQNMEQSQTVLQTLVKNNSILLLTRSLKRADEIISACDENPDRGNPVLGSRLRAHDFENGGEKFSGANGYDVYNGSHAPGKSSSVESVTGESKKSGITIDTLLYELTALKSTLYLLIRIGQTKAGASQLVQNEIFPIIRRLQVLAVDVDLGMEFLIETEGGVNNATVRLSLDMPLLIRDKFAAEQSGNNINGRDSFQVEREMGYRGGMGSSDDYVTNGRRSFNQTEVQLKSKTVSYYEILVPVFQLVGTILLSAGPSYRPGIKQAEQLLHQFRPLVQAIMKRETILAKIQASTSRPGGEGAESGMRARSGDEGLFQMAKLFTLIHGLVTHSE